MSKIVSLQEAQTDLSKLIASIRLDGEIVIVENTKPLAKIVPPNNIQPSLKKLSKLKKIEGFFNCDPEDIVHIDWSKEWNK
jgi:antitoxin (DNA-binding transcriptional repressor) of toxin-antitoxin stability system